MSVLNSLPDAVGRRVLDRRLDSCVVGVTSAVKTLLMGKAEREATDYAGWVAWLSDPLRRSRVYWHLVLSGPDAREAVVEGLGSHYVSTRRHCARARDDLVDESSFVALIDLLDDTDPLVRVAAIHGLACDRCKDDACRPVASAVLPKARCSTTLTRTCGRNAVELVGRFVHTHKSAEEAIVLAAEADVSPAVRK